MNSFNVRYWLSIASLALIHCSPRTFPIALLIASLLGPLGHADDKTAASKRTAQDSGSEQPTLFLRPSTSGGQGDRVTIGGDGAQYPVIVVRGTPYEMGRQLGTLVADQMQTFIPKAMAGLTAELNVSQDDLREVWSRTAAFTDDRVEQEMAGLADGSGMLLAQLQAMHAVPLLMPYSCSSIAAWGDATEDGHLYQTRNLDWSLEVRAHDFPVIVIYLPDDGIAHVVPTFAGMIGAHIENLGCQPRRQARSGNRRGLVLRQPLILGRASL